MFDCSNGIRLYVISSFCSVVSDGNSSNLISFLLALFPTLSLLSPSPLPLLLLSLSFCQLHNSLWYKQNYCSLIEKCSVCFQCLAPMNKAVINIFVQRSLYMVLSFYGTWNLPIFLKSYHIISIEKVIDYATGISLFQIWFPWCVCPEVGLLGHMEVLFPVF